MALRPATDKEQAEMKKNLAEILYRFDGNDALNETKIEYSGAMRYDFEDYTFVIDSPDEQWFFRKMYNKLLGKFGNE